MMGINSRAENRSPTVPSTVTGGLRCWQKGRCLLP